MQASEATPTKPDIRICHNAWTVFGMDEKGLPLDQPMAYLGRVQSWGDPKWKYHFFKFEWTVHGVTWVNNCHTYTDLKLDNEAAYAELFAHFIVKPMWPGNPPEKCGRDFRDVDDFWDEKWGPEPPIFYSQEEQDWIDEHDPMGPVFGEREEEVPEEESPDDMSTWPDDFLKNPSIPVQDSPYESGDVLELYSDFKPFFSPDGIGMGHLRYWFIADGRNNTPNLNTSDQTYMVYLPPPV